jgi:hypothetical protein
MPEWRGWKAFRSRVFSETNALLLAVTPRGPLSLGMNPLLCLSL